MERHAPLVDEVEIPLEQPVVVVRAAPAPRAPREGVLARRRRRFFPAAAHGSPPHEASGFIRRERLHRLVHDDDLGPRFGAGPNGWKRTVSQEVRVPDVRHDQARHRRILAQQVRPIPPIQQLEDVDLRGSKTSGEFNRRFRQGLDVISGLRRRSARQERSNQRCAKDSRTSRAFPAAAPDPVLSKMHQASTELLDSLTASSPNCSPE